MRRQGGWVNPRAVFIIWVVKGGFGQNRVGGTTLATPFRSRDVPDPAAEQLPISCRSGGYPRPGE